MRITERHLRSIIRSVIRESMSDDERYPSDDTIFAPFDKVNKKRDKVQDNDRSQVEHEMSGSDEIRRFMQRNRRAASERDRGSYETRGSIHSSQLDMLDDMGEIGSYDENDYDYEH